MNNKNNLVYREQLDDNVIEMLSEDIGSNYSLRTENTKTIVAALNEIKGKDIISNAVGSPLVFDDTFEIMGEKINGLTNEFKTKLLTLGVSVSGIDKFETLIRKLDEIDLGVDAEDLLGSFIESLSGILEDEGVELSGNETLGELIVKTDEEFDRQENEMNDIISDLNTQIENLTNELNNKGLDIISATELPATGKENQICVITDNPVDKFIIQTDTDIQEMDNEYINFYIGPVESTYAGEDALVTTSGIVSLNFYFIAAKQGEKYLNSYVYKNGTWVKMTIGYIYFIQDKVEKNNDYFGGIPSSSSSWRINSTYGLYCDGYGNMAKVCTIKNQIDFSLYSYIDITASLPTETTNSYIYLGIANINNGGLYTFPLNYDYTLTNYTVNTATTVNAKIEVKSNNPQTFTVDIRNWSGPGYLLISCNNSGSSRIVSISDIKFY